MTALFSSKKFKWVGLGLLSLMTMMGCSRKFGYDTDSSKSGAGDMNPGTGDTGAKQSVAISFSGSSPNYSNPAVIYLVSGNSFYTARDPSTGAPTTGGYDGDIKKMTLFPPISFTTKPSFIDTSKITIVPYDAAQDPFCGRINFMIDNSSLVLQNDPTNKLPTMTTCEFKLTSSTYYLNDTKIELLFNYTLKDWESSLGDTSQAQITAKLIDGAYSKPQDQLVLSFANNKIRDISPVTALINTVTLDLTDNAFSIVPRSISELIYLDKIDLRGSPISDLPFSFSSLVHLTKLLVSSKNLTAIPDSVFQLTKLQNLTFSDSNITFIPEAISQLTALQIIDFRNNQITAIPEAISQLVNLNKLWINNNQISTIPASISNLSNLKEFLASYNQISVIPDSIAQLTNLQILWLNNNNIFSIPDLIINLKNLSQILLNNNDIQLIPNNIYSWIKGIAYNLANNPGYITNFGN